MARSILFVTAFSMMFVACGRPTQPSGPKDGVVSLEAAAANKFVPALQSSQAVARVAINVAKLDRSGRPPANLALVVDTSGSMEGKAIDDARTAALALFDALSPKDRLAVVVFNSKTETILPSTPIDDADLGDVKKKIRAIRAEGTTDMAAGLAAGMNEVVAHLDPEGVNRVILLGDGVPNDEAPIAAMTESASRRGVSITALGLGDDYNETLMGKMAQSSGGKFQYVADSSKVASFFKEEVGRLEKTYARDAWLDIATGPGVHVSDVIGQQFAPTPGGVRVHVGDLALGEKMDVVVKLAVDGRKDGATIELMDAVLRYSDGVGAPHQAERRAFLGLHATSDNAKLASGKDASVEAVAVKAQEAADTLAQIKAARESDVPRPAPVAPARPVAGAQAAPPAQVLRQQHDAAMQVLQKH